MLRFLLCLVLITFFVLAWPAINIVRLSRLKSKTPDQIRGMYKSGFSIAGFLTTALGTTADLATTMTFNYGIFGWTVFGLGFFGLMMGLLIGDIVGILMQSHSIHQTKRNHPDFAEDQDGNPIVPPTTNSLTDL